MIKNRCLLFFKENIQILAILLTGFLLYFKSINFGYTYHDDTTLIIKNLGFLGSFSNIINSFRVSIFENLRMEDNFYRPILLLSLIFDTKLSVFYEGIYHLTNLVIHLLNTLVLFVFLRTFRVKKDLSLALTLFFTVHPVLVQAVSWIPGRNDSLLFLFVALYFICLSKFLEGKRSFYLLISIFFYFLSLFTKETAIVCLILTVVYKLFFFPKSDNKKFFILLFANLLITFFWYFLRKNAIKIPVEYSFIPAFLLFVKNIPGVFLYLGKFFLPLNLSTMTVIKDYPIYYGVVAAFLLLFFVYLSKSKDFKKVIFGAICFLGFFLPTIYGGNPNVVFIFLEHRMYVPALGLLIIISQLDFAKGFSFKKRSSLFFLFSLSLVFAVLNFRHQENFRDRLSFWTNAVETSPSNATSHWGMGMAYYSNNLLKEAEKEFLKGISLNSRQDAIRNNLGVVYLDWGKLDEAEKVFKEELSLKEYPDVLYNYGLVMYRLGNKAEAGDYWLRALSLDPDHQLTLKSLFFYHRERLEIMEAEYYREELNKRNIKF